MQAEWNDVGDPVISEILFVEILLWRVLQAIQYFWPSNSKNKFIESWSFVELFSVHFEDNSVFLL